MLCSLLDIRFNNEDPNESLKMIFRKAKLRVKPVIDFLGDTPLLIKLDESQLKATNPY